MGEPYELKFLGLRAGERPAWNVAYFGTSDVITGGPQSHLEFYATRANVEKRLRERAKQQLPTDEELRALRALRRAAGEYEDDWITSLEAQLTAYNFWKEQ